MLVIAAGVFLAAWQLPPSLFDPLGPGAFPLLVSGLLAALSLVLLGRLALGLSTGRSQTSIIVGMDGPQEHRRRPWLAVGLFAWTGVYALTLAFAQLGFLVPTIVYLAVLGFALSKRTRRDAMTAGAVAIIGGVATWLLFSKVFLVLWP
jgi:hypothetical protein